MIQANVTEDDEKTMARFLNGLNHPIKKIADFQPYSNLLELVHQATKAERQVQDDFKYAKYSAKTYGSSYQTPATSVTPTQLEHHQVPATSQVTRRLRQAQAILLLQATSSRKLH